MKKLFTLIVSLYFAIASCDTLAKSGDKEAKTINTKCYVTLYGGEQTILYQIIKENTFKNLATKLTNSSIMTTLSKNKQKVYEVFECVQTSDNFKNKFALAIEKVTPK
jgi:hypothetical protein